MVVTHGDIATWLVMEHNFNWQFGDFYRHIFYASDISNTYSFKGASFPPLAYCFFHFLYVINPIDAVNWRGIETATYNPLFFLLWNIVLFSSLFIAIENINSSSFSKFKSFVLFLCLIFSAPFMSGAIERGNPASFVFVVLLFAIYFSSSSNIVLRELALIFIAIAAGWKIYPAIFGFIYLRERRYTEAIRLVIYGMLFFFVPFYFTGGIVGFKNYFNILNGLQVGMSPRWTDIKNFYTATSLALGVKPSALVGSILQISSFIIILVGIFISKSRWQTILFASSIMAICVSGSYRYVSIYMAIPLIFFFVDIKNKGKTTKLDYVNAVLFALAFTIPVYGYVLNIGECDMYIFLPIYLIVIINIIYVFWSKLISGSSSGRTRTAMTFRRP